MALICRSTACLRLLGDALRPEDEVTGLLGCPPTKSHLASIQAPPGAKAPSRTGAWLLSAEERSPGDLDAQIGELPSKLTNDLEVWRDLTHKFRTSVFCGVFLHGQSEGIAVSRAPCSPLESEAWNSASTSMAARTCDGQKRRRDLLQYRHRRVLHLPLDPAHVGPVHPGVDRERLLRNPG